MKINSSFLLKKRDNRVSCWREAALEYALHAEACSGTSRAASDTNNTLTLNLIQAGFSNARVEKEYQDAMAELSI